MFSKRYLVIFLAAYAALVGMSGSLSAQAIGDNMCRDARQFVKYRFEAPGSSKFIYAVQHSKFEKARDIKLEVVSDTGRVQPFAGFSLQNGPVVFVPSGFMDFYCATVVAEWLVTAVIRRRFEVA